ncbi:Cytosolic Fe-S cluster assembly factor NBP35 [Spraguea lophii 42_110]|uniref:Cytosolic Fe-S cluster assembly factor NBP35 n=1 Tax=Spraguea lophii (strain 42_110) TaxID=1358809 RepID=S7WAK4_SPRLO|nr:Cytosolic Fe-S cluster assembly factor NBP35 [Spraguea lophii 42_110]
MENELKIFNKTTIETEIKDNIKNNRVIAVMSGKGGVGKSTTTRILSEYLSFNAGVCIIDFDINSPVMPIMTNTLNEYILEEDKIHPIKVKENLYSISRSNLIAYENERAIDPTKKQRLMYNILKNISTEDFKYIIFDTPPGVEEEHINIAPFIDYAIIVSTPQDLALDDVKRQLSFCKKAGVKILGIVENMKNYICRKCNKENIIFSGSNVKKYCDEKNIEYLGEIKIKQEIVKAMDSGCFIEEETIKKISEKITEKYLE